MSREERRNAELLYNLRTITEMQENYDYTDWLSYFNSLMPEETQLVASDQIIVADLNFVLNLGSLLNETPKRVVANYLMWRQASASVAYLPTRFRQRQELYSRQTTGIETQTPRWLSCVQSTLNVFPHAFGALYVRKHFNEEAKTKVLDMVKNIKDEFKIMLSEIDWMDAETKTAANAKADSMKEQMGFADELLDDDKLVEYYNTFEATINENEYYESVFGWNKASSLRNNRRLREPIDKDDWTSVTTPAIVNAFYSSLENTIKFPAGILQGAFFNPNRPHYMNYGGIGFVIGHGKFNFFI